MIENSFLNEISGKNINFLIGSGINAPTIPTLSIGSSDSKLKYTFEDLITHARIKENNTYVAYLLIYFYLKTVRIGFNPKKLKDDSLKRNYTTFINLLIKRLTNESNDKPKRVNIFSTNYDLMFESAFDYISQKNNQVNFNDGSYGFINRYISSERFHVKSLQSGVYDLYNFEIPMINLIKMHGSLSWELDGNRIKLNYKNNPVRNYDEILEESNVSENLDNLHIKIIEKKIFEEIKKDSLYYDAKNEKFIRDYEQHLQFKVAETLQLDNCEYSLDETVDYLIEYIDDFERNSAIDIKLEDFHNDFRKLLIVNPTKKKFNETVFEQHYYQMIRVLSQELERKQTVLIVFGFSFNDEHLLEIVRRSAFNDQLMIYIISYSSDGQAEINEMFSEYTNVRYLPSDFSKYSGDFNFLINLMKGNFNNE